MHSDLRMQTKSSTGCMFKSNSQSTSRCVSLEVTRAGASRGSLERSSFALHETRATRRNILERSILHVTAASIIPSLAARPSFAEYSDREYLPSIADKDYGKSRYNYPDFVFTESGLQYKDMVEGKGAVLKPGQTALVDWDGYTLGYYGRPFEARNKTKGGAFTGDDKGFITISVDDDKVIPAFREVIVGMKVGCIRRVIVPGGSDMGYPKGKGWTLGVPQPSTFSGKRALGFVLENEGMIDKTLLFDIELIRIVDIR